jgi:Aspartyl protease
VVAAPGTLRQTLASGGLANLTPFNALVDTGATHTCIAPSVAQRLNLAPRSMMPVSVPTGPGAANMYIVDLGIGFGDPAGATIDWFAFENVQVMEFLGNSPHYEGLVGRDVICRGMFSIGLDGRFTFSL